MKNIIDILKSKPFFDSYAGASADDIKKAETELSLTFTDEYKQYLAAFGEASYEGHELTGICVTKRLHVVDVTKEEREQNPQVLSNWYVVEQLNIDDAVIWQTPSGEIYQTIPEATPLKLCGSLSEYINL